MYSVAEAVNSLNSFSERTQPSGFVAKNKVADSRYQYTATSHHSRWKHSWMWGQLHLLRLRSHRHEYEYEY